MHAKYEDLCSVLDDMAKYITDRCSNSNSKPMSVANGWNFLMVNQFYVAQYISSLSSYVRSVDCETIFPDMEEFLNNFLEGARASYATLIEQSIFQNNAQYVSVLFCSMQLLESKLHRTLGFVPINIQSAPKELLKDVRSKEASLKNIGPRLESIKEKIDVIDKAYDAVQNLPVDVEGIEEFKRDARESYKKISVIQNDCEKTSEDVSQKLSLIQEAAAEAERLVKTCDEACRAATATGLASAFGERARKLDWSVLLWAGALLIALGIASYVGSHRADAISTALKDGKDWGVIWIHIAISVASVGAPLWFAWLATIQVRDRFKLAEDYAFKAAVARAYEGYRSEAVKLDGDFQSRLFGSALTRFDEQPLRFVSRESDGSPLHAFLNSPALRSAVSERTDLRQGIEHFFPGVLGGVAVGSVSNGKSVRKTAAREEPEEDS